MGTGCTVQDQSFTGGFINNINSVGIRLSSTTLCTLENNSFSTFFEGIYIVNTSNGNTIYNNTLQDNTWAGLVLDGATNTTVYQNNFINNLLQALAQNGSGNAFYQGTIGNYWSDWGSTDPRPIYGNEGLYDEYPNITPF